MAILHADRRALTLGATPWPDWSADRGPPGTYVPVGAPLASVFADAQTADEAQRLALARLAELEDLLYEHAKS
jgi:predicted ATP-grasp superfamily ATP-dependent carboligase